MISVAGYKVKGWVTISDNTSAINTICFGKPGRKASVTISVTPG